MPVHPGTRLGNYEILSELFLQSKHYESDPDFSPDGRWIAYHSDGSGRPELYVRRFPDSGRKWQVSIDGGRSPRWNPRGGELFYSTGDNMMAVEVDTGGELALGTPRPLFEASPNNYGLMPGGNGFVMVSYRESDPTRGAGLNWTEVLKSSASASKGKSSSWSAASAPIRCETRRALPWSRFEIARRSESRRTRVRPCAA